MRTTGHVPHTTCHVPLSGHVPLSVMSCALLGDDAHFIEGFPLVYS